jgi:hypothetical protein
MHFWIKQNILIFPVIILIAMLIKIPIKIKSLSDSNFKKCLFYGISILLTLYFKSITVVLLGQTPVHPDLGLHGQVTWLSDTKIRVAYDWSDEAQLLDWATTNGSTLVRGNGIVTINGGEASVRSMVWRQLIKCTRIYAQDAIAVNSSYAHLNFITNVTGWTGYNFNPHEIIGLIYISYGNIWVENATSSTLSAPQIVLGNKYSIEINITETSITAKSTSDNVTYLQNLSAPPDPDRQVAVGGWGGDTEWGKLTIEGEINTAWQLPPDMIDIQSGGKSFSPVIEVVGNPVVEWVFSDGSVSSSTAPVMDYGSIGSRHNLLKVTPWSSLIGINVGYDANDGGYGGFTLVDNQYILGFQNLDLVKNSLQYLCASYSPLTDLDLSEFPVIKFVELLFCTNLASVKLGTHPSLERLCVEDCNLTSLDISGCSALEDFRAAINTFPSINWGATGAKLWHICVRDNPKFLANLPDLAQFPLLRELLVWNDNQTGAFVCNNPLIQRIDAYDNHFTSADLSGCSGLKQLSLSGSKLSSLNLGTANSIIDVQLVDCNLNVSQIDYILQTLDERGLINGKLELTENAPPSDNGMLHHNNLKGKGWTINITDPGQLIPITGITITGAGGMTTIDTDNGTLQLSAEVVPSYSTNKTITWSIVNNSRLASIDETGLVTALNNGLVTVRGTANDGSGIYGELVISITNQVNPGDENDISVGKIIVDIYELRIILSDDYTSWNARLIDLQGKIVSSKYVESDILSFDISTLTPGIYLIVFSKDDKIRIAEFFKP